VSPSRILAIARRIAQGFRRDERTLGLMFVVPLVVTALLGWVLNDTKDTVVDVVYVNPGGEIGDRILAALQTAASDPENDLHLVDPVSTEAAAEAAVRDGTADLGIVVPSDLVAQVLAGQRPTFTIISEGTDPAAEAGRFGTLQAALADIAGQLAPPGVTPPIIPQVERRTVYLSPDASQVDVLAPIFLGFFGYFFVFLLTGVSFLRERVGGTLERLLATPVTRGEIVVGYSLGFGIFATIQVLVLTLFVLGGIQVPAIGPIGAWTFGLDVHIAGSPLVAFLVAVLLAIGAVNLGIFLSTFARTELQVVQFIPIVIVPQILLGGVLWPVDRLPGVLQAISQVMPVRYAVDALREVMLKGADLSSSSVQLDLAVLAGVAVFFIVLATATIKREVA